MYSIPYYVAFARLELSVARFMAGPHLEMKKLVRGLVRRIIPIAVAERHRSACPWVRLYILAIS
jgi:hypothetical protein